MSAKHFPLREGITTRQVLAVVRNAIESGVADWQTIIPGIEGDMERRRTRPYVSLGVRSDETETRYVFGIHTGLRSTLVGHYIVGSGEIMVCTPNNYQNWYSASQYDRLRIVIHDRIVHHADIRDKSKPARV